MSVNSGARSKTVIDIVSNFFIGIGLGNPMFLVLIALAFFLAGASHEYAPVAMWLGFAFAGYSAIANDSVQTLGTFLASNAHRKWWVLWLFIGSIFLVTHGYSWFMYGGDVSHQRLAAKGFDIAPESFTFLQIAAPIFLLILTRLRMPVSTTFLILTSFATSSSGLGKVFAKSLSGYGIAFGVALVAWLIIAKFWDRIFDGKPARWWYIVQWCSTGFLWSVWLMQDVANIAVFLPRSLSGYEFLGFGGFIFLGLGILFYMRGDKIQQVVTEKTHIIDVRAATLVDMVYAGVLYYFKMLNNVPMSTTWVFIGLLAGRELALLIGRSKDRSVKKVMLLIGKDLLFVSIGLFVSIVLALFSNEGLRNSIMSSLGM